MWRIGMIQCLGSRGLGNTILGLLLMVVRVVVGLGSIVISNLVIVLFVGWRVLPVSPFLVHLSSIVYFVIVLACRPRLSLTFQRSAPNAPPTHPGHPIPSSLVHTSLNPD